MPQSSTKSSTKRKGFFSDAPAREDDEARQREVAALLPPRRVVLQDLPVDRIEPNPFQARQQFTDLDELSAALQAQGFITRLRVRPAPEQPGHFQLAYGERRLRAAKLAGLTEVPCEVADHTDDELLEIGLAENIQRRDLEPLDEARAFRLFIDQRNYSIRRLAERIGKDKSYVEDRLALLRTPEDVQETVPAESGNQTAPGETAPGGPAGAVESAVTIDGVVYPEAAPWRNEDIASRPVSKRGRGSATPASSLRREMGTLRVILARWEKALPDSTAQERSILTGYVQEIQDATRRLQAELQPSDGDLEE